MSGLGPAACCMLARLPAASVARHIYELSYPEKITIYYSVLQYSSLF